MSNRVKVLIADDSKDFTTMLGNCISLYPDIEVVGIAQNGIEVLKLLEQQKPDVLLLDIIMPEMDGLEVLRHLKNMGDQAPHVFMLSAVSSESAAFQSINMGASYLLKPIDAKTIVERIRSVMKKA
jgi:two-component system response regulator (stage 0 sporulation protein A)